jgi:hypothetical protein
MSKIPSTLTDKRAELFQERLQLSSRIAELDKHIEALDYAMQIVDPNWVPSERVKRKYRQSKLPHGAVPQNCLAILRQQGALWTADLAKAVAMRCKASLTDKRAETAFASTVVATLRRLEGKGVVEIVERDATAKNLKWKLSTNPNGRLSVH